MKIHTETLDFNVLVLVVTCRMSTVSGWSDRCQANWSTEGIEASHGKTRQGLKSCTFDKINLCRTDPVVVPVPGNAFQRC